MSAESGVLYADCERSLASLDPAMLEPLRGTTLFITGATGFVGLWISVLAACLNDTRGFDLKVVGLARGRSRLIERAPFLLDRPDYRFASGDVRQLVELPPDTAWVMHAAGSPDSREHATDPVETMSVFADGTERVLRLAGQAAGLRSLLHFSSASATASAPLDASGAYAAAKRYSEVLCAAFRSQARLPIVVTRPHTFMGPFQALDAPWAANNFLQAALAGQPLKLLGDGESIRSFLYGSDMAVLALLQLVHGRPGAAYDLGGTEPISLRRLAELVVARAGRPLEIRYNTAGRAETTRLVPDMTPSLTQFGFTPALDTAAAVERTLAWQRSASGAREATLA